MKGRAPSVNRYFRGNARWLRSGASWPILQVEYDPHGANAWTQAVGKTELVTTADGDGAREAVLGSRLSASCPQARPGRDGVQSDPAPAAVHLMTAIAYPAALRPLCVSMFIEASCTGTGSGLGLGIGLDPVRGLLPDSGR